MNETILNGIDAAAFVWNILWRPNQTNFKSFNILDCISLSFEEKTENKVSGWIFTSAEGTIKSKLKTKWNFNNIILRCKDGNNAIRAHYILSNSGEWVVIKQENDLNKLITAPFSNFLVLLGNLRGKTTFAEIVCENEINNSVFKKKIKTYLLYHSTKFGNKNDEKIPTERILCQNKSINKQCSKFMKNLVSILENENEGKVIKINGIKVLVVIEEDLNLNLNNNLNLTNFDTSIDEIMKI
jgi:hypothetical protein